MLVVSNLIADTGNGFIFEEDVLDGKYAVRADNANQLLRQLARIGGVLDRDGSRAAISADRPNVDVDAALMRLMLIELPPALAADVPNTKLGPFRVSPGPRCADRLNGANGFRQTELIRSPRVV